MEKQVIRKTTSIKVEPELWKDFKIHCINKKIEISVFLEKLIREALK